MNIKQLEQSIVRPQLSNDHQMDALKRLRRAQLRVHRVNFPEERLPSFLQWTACVCIGYAVLVCLHMIFG